MLKSYYFILGELTNLQTWSVLLVPKLQVFYLCRESFQFSDFSFVNVARYVEIVHRQRPEIINKSFGIVFIIDRFLRVLFISMINIL